MTRMLLLLALALGGCGQQATTAGDRSAGARLESAARTAGIVADADAPLEGSWARDTDRICVVGIGASSRIGVSVDYGEDQGCAASGTVERSGESLTLAFGSCRFAARYEGDRIIFPAEVPAACESLCSGRATLAAIAVDRLSGSRSEASTLRSPSGKELCTG